MDANIMIYLLIGVTFGAVLFFAIRSKRAVDERKDDPHAETSSLAPESNDRQPSSADNRQ